MNRHAQNRSKENTYSPFELVFYSLLIPGLGRWRKQRAVSAWGWTGLIYGLLIWQSLNWIYPHTSLWFSFFLTLLPWIFLGLHAWTLYMDLAPGSSVAAHRPWKAAMLSMLWPGLGHLYIRKALQGWFLLISLPAAYGLAWLVGSRQPETLSAVFFAAALIYHIAIGTYSIHNAFRVQLHRTTLFVPRRKGFVTIIAVGMSIWLITLLSVPWAVDIYRVYQPSAAITAEETQTDKVLVLARKKMLSPAIFERGAVTVYRTKGTRYRLGIVAGAAAQPPLAEIMISMADFYDTSLREQVLPNQVTAKGTRLVWPLTEARRLE